MINIPIWLFVILVTLSLICVISFVVALIGYIQVSKIDKHDKEHH